MVNTESILALASGIAGFTDYREFVKARYAQVKALLPDYSYRQFSARAGFSSPNYLKLIELKLRHLGSAETARKFAKGLFLTEADTEYFVAMVKDDLDRRTQAGWYAPVRRPTARRPKFS